MSLIVTRKTLLSENEQTSFRQVEEWANGLQWNNITVDVTLFSYSTTLQSNPPLFCLDPFGFTHLRGTLTTLTSSTPLIIASLPTSAAPVSPQTLTMETQFAVSGDGLGSSPLIATADGNLAQASNAIGGISNEAGDIFYLDGIVFPTF